MTARPFLVVVALVAFVLSSAVADDTPEAGREYEMKNFQLVFLLQDPDFEEDPLVAEDRAAHRVDRYKTVGRLYLKNLVRDGVAIIAGELPDHEEIRQVAIIDAETTGDAELVLGRHPALEDGRLELQIYPWWAAKDILQVPENPELLTTALLGLLKRPSGAPSFTSEELERIQAGHLAHLEKMADMGELVIAGPVDRGGDLRGILIFRTDDERRIEKLASEDPAIQAGRLKLELYRWTVPKQCFPES